jgi:predicted nucleotidyltransferase
MEKHQPINYHLIVPVGTQIVTSVEIKGSGGEVFYPRGAVGEIIKAPVDNTHAYRVRFLDGSEYNLHRQELAIRKQVQSGDLFQPENADFDPSPHLIYLCVLGSRAYGLENESSDTDRRGIYVAPAEMQWSLYGAPEQVEKQETQECYWEVQRFLVLALKANPNILECLYTPLVEHAAPLAEELLAMRASFLSKLIFQTYNGYVMSQFKKLEQDLRTRGAIKMKHAMHLIRLLLAGITALEEGYVPVRVEQHRERLLSIRRGEVSWEEVNAWRLSLHKTFDAAFATTSLPERPDYAKANEYLIRVRRSMVVS